MAHTDLVSLLLSFTTFDFDYFIQQHFTLLLTGAFVGMTYTSLYLLAHLPTLLPFHRVSLHLPNLFLGFLPLSLAVWVGITRVQDYRHNPSDVLGGMIVGMTFAGVGWWAFGRRGAKAWRISLNDYGDREGRAYHPQGYERIGGDPAAIVTSP